MLIRDELKELVAGAIKAAMAAGKLGDLSECTEPVLIEKPKLVDHGDLACGIALKLARGAKMPPIKIAEIIASYIRENPNAGDGAINGLVVAPPGFLNFKLGNKWLASSLQEILNKGSDFGRDPSGSGKRVLIEYVSANPTGELHIGHGRNAVFGSCLANLLRFSGCSVEEEFYVNDTGEQIAGLGACVWAIYLKKLGRTAEYPTTGYPEDSLTDYVDQVIEEHGDVFAALTQEEGIMQIGQLTKEIIQKQHQELLERLRIKFDRWYSETSLHEQGKVAAVLDQFVKRGYAYESEGALWLKTDELGDQRARVLRKSSGATTYLANDSAYHLEKYERGYDLMINIWGADHHGQVPGLKAAMKALGKDPDRLEVVLTQIVNLRRGGELVRMSKRRGTVVTLAEVMDEVGVDAVRYHLGESNPQNPIDFDLEEVKKQSRENPAFYIQYAHARCCAIFRRVLEPVVDVANAKTEEPLLSKEKWQDYLTEYKNSAQVFEPLFDQSAEIFAHQKSLVMTLDGLPQEVKEAALTRQPGRLARYAFQVANDLQKFYEVSRVITDDPVVTKARLGLVAATRQVLANVLGILGVSAPERM
jgi:arginyl-tRNA synthetase